MPLTVRNADSGKMETDMASSKSWKVGLAITLAVIIVVALIWYKAASNPYRPVTLAERPAPQAETAEPQEEEIPPTESEDFADEIDIEVEDILDSKYGMPAQSAAENQFGRPAPTIMVEKSRFKQLGLTIAMYYSSVVFASSCSSRSLSSLSSDTPSTWRSMKRTT